VGGHFQVKVEWISDDIPNDQSGGRVGGLVSGENLEIGGLGPPSQTNGHCDLPAGLGLLASPTEILSREKMSLAVQYLW